MKYALILLFAGLLLVACSAKQKTLSTPPETQTAEPEYYKSLLPLDSTLIRDTLPNGITYYIRKNEKFYEIC